jgi:hypothetical protein
MRNMCITIHSRPLPKLSVLSSGEAGGEGCDIWLGGQSAVITDIPERILNSGTDNVPEFSEHWSHM